MSDFIKLLISGFVAGAIALGTGYYLGSHKSTPENTSKFLSATGITIGTEYKIRSIRVIDGHIYDVVLENSHRYLVQLNGSTESAPEAKEQVIQILNDIQRQGKPLLLIFQQWSGSRERWMVDIKIDIDKATNLTEWLAARNLLYCK